MDGQPPLPRFGASRPLRLLCNGLTVKGYPGFPVPNGRVLRFLCLRLLPRAVVLSGGERVGAGAPLTIADRYRPRDWKGGAGEQTIRERMGARVR